MTHPAPAAAARTRKLAFDFSRPFGPLEIHEECHMSLTRVSFNGGAACGYTHGIFCRALEPKTADPTIHVVTFHLSGLVQEYGLNAVSIWMRKPFGDLDSQPLFVFQSQEFAPRNPSCVTLAVNDANGSAWLVVASSFLTGEKRNREDEQPQWYHHSEEVQHAWRQVNEGVWAREFTVDGLAETIVGMPIPCVGLSLCATLSSRAEIVPCPARIKDALSTLTAKGGSHSTIYYEPGL